MKFEIQENKGGTQITLIPETIEETSQLLRASKNAARKPVELHYAFYPGQTPQCNIWIGKVAEKNQYNSVSNKKVK